MDEQEIFLQNLGLVNSANLRFNEKTNTTENVSNESCWKLKTKLYIRSFRKGRNKFSVENNGNNNILKKNYNIENTTEDGISDESSSDKSSPDDDYDNQEDKDELNNDKTIFKRRKRKNGKNNNDNKNASKKSKLSKEEIEALAQAFISIPLVEAKQNLFLEKPSKIIISAKVKFDDSENLNMLRIVILSGRYGHGHRTSFWKKYIHMFPNRSLGTLVSHWKYAIVQNPKRTRLMLKAIGFHTDVVERILKLIISIGIAEDEQLDRSIPIVPKENLEELQNFIETRRLHFFG